MEMAPDTVEEEARRMLRALELARESGGLASPNPQVGCVVVRSGQVLGEGAHHFEQRDHAEVVALQQARAKQLSTEGATAYVTLEPCAHHGRTGPCSDALIAAGIKRCVIATVDPNPLVRGQGIGRLRDAGVEVRVGLLEREARQLNQAFAHFIQRRTPFVTLKAGLSADGRLAPPPALRTPHQPHWLTGPESRLETHRLRHRADAILTGIGTVLADDPALTDRSGRPRRRRLLRVVLDSRLRLPLTSQLVRSAEAGDLLLLTSSSAEEAAAKALAARGVEVVRMDAERGLLYLPAVFALLAERNAISLLLETGSALNGSFLAQELVDKVELFYAPARLGNDAVPFAANGTSPFALEQALGELERRPLGEDVRVSGLLHDPWDGVV